MPINEQIRKLNEMIAAAQEMVAFTGAGISAESGIPTYRGDDGLWNTYDPSKFADINHFYTEPAYYWNFFKEVRYPIISRAQPNKAHEVLAEFEKQGKLKTLITQNIDGLHHLAGSTSVLELHGNTRRIICLTCRIHYSMEAVYEMLQEQLPPKCPACGGVLKPDVVFFGEALPVNTLYEALQASRTCELFMVIGSSLVVQPAASMPVMAKENGATLIIINKDPTPLDSMADIVIHEKASHVLSLK